MQEGLCWARPALLCKPGWVLCRCLALLLSWAPSVVRGRETWCGPGKDGGKRHRERLRHDTCRTAALTRGKRCAGVDGPAEKAKYGHEPWLREGATRPQTCDSSLPVPAPRLFTRPAKRSKHRFEKRSRPSWKAPQPEGRHRGGWETAHLADYGR